MDMEHDNKREGEPKVRSASGCFAMALLCSALIIRNQQFHSGNKDRLICSLIDMIVLTWPSLAPL